MYNFIRVPSRRHWTHLEELKLHDLPDGILGREPTAHVRPGEEAPKPLMETNK